MLQKITFILAIFLLLTANQNTIALSQNTDIKSKDYQPHDIIFIDSDDDFADFGFEGTGKEGDPFLIEGFNITNLADMLMLIYIVNTSSYFKIQNNFINGEIGIFLYNLSNAIIENNIISTYGGGIVTDKCSNIRISSNIFTQKRGSGISVIRTTDFKVDSNIVNSVFGIGVAISSDGEIESNNMDNNKLGIALDYAFNLVIESNNISNAWYGIQLYRSNQSLLIYNTIKNCSMSGLNSHISRDNTLSFNNFIDNNLKISSQAHSDLDNNFTHNYWNDWISPDDDNDGIVDNPYKIDGGNNTDNFPLTKIFVQTESDSDSIELSLNYKKLSIFILVILSFTRRKSIKHIL